jgi:hypothetical protein
MRATAWLFVSGILSSVPAAAAESAEPIRAPNTGPSVAMLGGYGLQLNTIASGGVSAYRLGVGTRVGTTLPFHLYVGGTLVAFFGGAVSASGEGGAFYDAHYHVTYGGAEAGYDVNLGRVLLRPYVGFGLLAAIGHTTVGTTSIGENEPFLYVAPAGLVAYRVRAMFFGLDVRMAIPPAQPSTAWAPAAMLHVGVQLGGRDR